MIVEIAGVYQPALMELIETYKLGYGLRLEDIALADAFRRVNLMDSKASCGSAMVLSFDTLFRMIPVLEGHGKDEVIEMLDRLNDYEILNIKHAEEEFIVYSLGENMFNLFYS